MLRLILALQSVDAIPPDFDLATVKPAAPETIVVTARRQSQRIEREPVSNAPPLGRAEIGLFGNAKADLHVDSQSFGNGTTSKRVMVGVKIPF